MCVTSFTKTDHHKSSWQKRSCSSLESWSLYCRDHRTTVTNISHEHTQILHPIVPMWSYFYNTKLLIKKNNWNYDEIKLWKKNVEIHKPNNYSYLPAPMKQISKFYDDTCLQTRCWISTYINTKIYACTINTRWMSLFNNTKHFLFTVDI